MAQDLGPRSTDERPHRGERLGFEVSHGMLSGVHRLQELGDGERVVNGIRGVSSDLRYVQDDRTDITPQTVPGTEVFEGLHRYDDSRELRRRIQALGYTSIGAQKMSWKADGVWRCP